MGENVLKDLHYLSVQWCYLNVYEKKRKSRNEGIMVSCVLLAFHAATDKNVIREKLNDIDNIIVSPLWWSEIKVQVILFWSEVKWSEVKWIEVNYGEVLGNKSAMYNRVLLPASANCFVIWRHDVQTDFRNACFRTKNNPSSPPNVPFNAVKPE
jgi:hypothetical protein